MFKLENVFFIALCLIFTQSAKCIDLSKEDHLLKQNNNLSSDSRGFLKILIKISTVLRKNDIKIDFNRHDNTPSNNWKVLVCLSSRRKKSMQDLRDCKRGNAYKSQLQPHARKMLTTEFEELYFPITDKTAAHQVIFVKTRTSNISTTSINHYFSNISSNLYGDGSTHDFILKSLSRQKKEKVMATLSVVCSPNFYGAHCELFCRPPTARHQCDHVTGTLKCAKGWIGENCGINVFVPREQASQFIKRRQKRANSNFLEELAQGNIERECLEEVCSREEAREAFEDDALTNAFWRAYTDPDHCNPNPCDPNHTNHCEDMIGNYSCHCHSGYTGKHCEIAIGACRNNPCRNGGTCVSLTATKYSCVCPDGFRGRICSINIDDCMQSNCGLNGVCIDGVNSFSCLCDDGFEGQQCDQNIDECSSNPCENGGSCVDHVAFYSCQCPRRYMGKNCQNEINPCQENPCLHGGRCKVTPDLNFTCSCGADFTGEVCQHHVESICATAPCLNGGTCYEIVNNITDELNPDYPDVPQEFGCACSIEFTGHVCEERVNPCYVDQDLCPRNATCVGLDHEYICVCPKGYMGDYCQLPGNNSETLDRLACNENPCTNDARCLSYQNKTTCICRPGFEGLRCEFETNYCSSHPCTNGGDCIPVPSGFYCNCPQGFRGEYCEEDIDECSLDRRVCQNRATCSNTKGSFQCLCGPYHAGRFCEHPFDPCLSDPCVNGGTCDRETTGYVCDCLEGYGGRNCQRVIDPCTEITNPCINGASCTSNPQVPTEAVCTCREGFYGRSCSNRVDNCAVKSNTSILVNGNLVHPLVERNDCGKNGDCVSTDAGFICNCHLGFEGKRCETAYVLPIVNCTSENCRCSVELVEEVRYKTRSTSQLQCQYQHYNKGTCNKPTCITSVCKEQQNIYECTWHSECLSAYLASQLSERLVNTSFDCPVLEITLDRSKLENDTTVQHFCDDIRNLPSYQRFSEVLVHCYLLQLNDNNSSLAVSLDSVKSQKEALLLASDVFQTLELIVKSDEHEEKNPGLATSFSAIMEIRYAEASARLPATTELMTATTPEVVRHDDSSFHYYVIIVILTVVILTCFIAAFVCFYRRKKKNELLISYVVNPNSTLTQNGQPMQESTNTPRSPASLSASVLRRKSNISRSNNEYANQAIVQQQQISEALKTRHNVESNPYVMTPYATIGASSTLSGSRSSFGSDHTNKLVEESTIDYGMMQKASEDQIPNHYEKMTRFSTSTDRLPTIDDYAFAVENPSKQLIKKKGKDTKKYATLSALASKNLPNEYEEINVKMNCNDHYEMIGAVAVPLYNNLQMQIQNEEKDRKSLEDNPYHFATEMPSMGVPSFLPPQKTATSSNLPVEPVYILPSTSIGKFLNQTNSTQNTNGNQLYSNTDVGQNKRSCGSPVFFTNQQLPFFSEKKTELPRKSSTLRKK